MQDKRRNFFFFYSRYKVCFQTGGNDPVKGEGCRTNDAKSMKGQKGVVQAGPQRTQGDLTLVIEEAYYRDCL